MRLNLLLLKVSLQEFESADVFHLLKEKNVDATFEISCIQMVIPRCY